MYRDRTNYFVTVLGGLASFLTASSRSCALNNSSLSPPKSHHDVHSSHPTPSPTRSCAPAHSCMLMAMESCMCPRRELSRLPNFHPHKGWWHEDGHKIQALSYFQCPLVSSDLGIQVQKFSILNQFSFHIRNIYCNFYNKFASSE